MELIEGSRSWLALFVVAVVVVVVVETLVVVEL